MDGKETKDTQSKPTTVTLEDSKGKLQPLITRLETIRDEVTDDGDAALRFKGNLNSAITSLGTAKDGV